MNDALALRVTYALSRVLIFILFSLMGLRRAVIRDNLARSFSGLAPAAPESHRIGATAGCRGLAGSGSRTVCCGGRYRRSGLAPIPRGLSRWCHENTRSGDELEPVLVFSSQVTG